MSNEAPAWEFRPHEGRQRQFMEHPARVVGYAGAPNTGKTSVMLYHHAYLLDFETQRWKRGEIHQSDAWVMFFRRVMPNLKQVMHIAHQTFPLCHDPPPKWHEQDKYYEYPCGLVFQFGAMEGSNDWSKFMGPSYIEVNIDEAPEFEEEQIDQIDTRIRTKHRCLEPFLNLRWGANPQGPGLPWVRRRWLDTYKKKGIPYGTTLRKRIRDPDTGVTIERDEVFIHALPEDNPSGYATGTYRASLLQSRPHIARALLAGDFYYVSGGLFSDFWDARLHVCDDHMPPPGTYRFRSCDFGIHAHSSITWWYVDHDGCMTAYYHLYLRGLTADKQAARVREVERWFGDWDEEAGRSMLLRSPLDAQCFKRTGTSGPTIAKEFWEHGVAWIPSVKDRFNGIAELCRRLSNHVEARRADGTTYKRPLIRWMKRCKVPVDMIPVTPEDKEHPGEVADGFEDHCVDDTIAACQSNPLRPRLVVTPDDYDEMEDYRPRRLPRRIADIG